MSVWKHLPKSSGLGKLSKKHKKAFAKSQGKRKAQRPIIKKRMKDLSSPERKAAIAAKKQVRIANKKEVVPTKLQWHFWGSRQTLEAKNKVVASLKRQGYKVRVDGIGDYYKIYTQGKASRYS